MIARSIYRIRILNRYYRITRFYEFMQNLALKSGLLLGILIVLYLILDYFILDAEMILDTFASKFSPLAIFSLFFTSEFLMGLIPPEFFIVWTSKTINPWFHVFLLGTLSYLVGLLAYYLGKKLFTITAVRKYVETKVSRHITNLRRWGGVFIFIGAMLPIPYSMVSLTSGLINYKIKHYLLWSLFRYVRFFLYAIIVFRIM